MVPVSRTLLPSLGSFHSLRTSSRIPQEDNPNAAALSHRLAQLQEPGHQGKAALSLCLLDARALIFPSQDAESAIRLKFLEPLVQPA